jgi:hypothetical protein
MNGLQIISGRNLSNPIDGTISSLAAIKIGRQQDVFNRERCER